MSDRFDASAEVAVVGAGIVGACVARELARRGIPTALYDPAPGLGASYGNAGMVTETECRPIGPERLRESLGMLLAGRISIGHDREAWRALPGWLGRHLRCSFGRSPEIVMAHLHDLAGRSIELYRAMGEEGLELGFRRAGWLWPFADGGALRHMEAELRRLRSVGAAIEELSGEECRRREPRLSDRVAAGLLFTRDAQLDPTRAVPAIIGAAVAAGARQVPLAVTGLESAGGRVTAVRTAAGRSPVAAVVLCAGTASRRLARMLGARLPIVPGHGWSVTVPQPSPAPSLPLMLAEHDVVVSPLRSAVRLTTGMRLGGEPPAPPDRDEVRRLLGAVERMLPGLGPLEGGSVWIGARPMTPSGLPLIGRLPGSENAIVAAGHGTLGVTLGAVTGVEVASLL